jgi:hypothetical protein
MLTAIFGMTLVLVWAAFWWWRILPQVKEGERMHLALTVAAAASLAILAAIVGSWWLKAFEERHTSLDETRGIVRNARVTFQAAIREARVATRTTPSEAPPDALVREVLHEFDRLEQELQSGADRSSEMLDAIAAQARELRRARAHFISPRAAILHAGKAALDDMREWGVPQASLHRVTAELVPLLASPQPADARAALSALLELRDQWDPYATWYNGFMGRTAAALLAILLFAVTVAGAAFREGHLLTSFALAGVGGAALSVLSRLPPLAAYGEATQYLFRIVSRVGTGFAASLIGAGLLATGIISINLPEAGSFDGMVAECSAFPPSRPRTAPLPPVEGKPLPAATEGAPKPCGTTHVLIFLAIAMILGFSERALATFEDRVFPSGTLVPVPVKQELLHPDGPEKDPSTAEELRRRTEAAAREALEVAERAEAVTSDAARAAGATLTAAGDSPESPETRRTQEAARETVEAIAEVQKATAETAEATQEVVDAAAKAAVAPDEASDSDAVEALPETEGAAPVSRGGDDVTAANTRPDKR